MKLFNKTKRTAIGLDVGGRHVNAVQLDAPRAGRSSQVMAVGCPHRDADTLIETFEREGLEVAALDVRASALARATRPLLPADKPICAVLDVGWSGTMLVMLHGGTVVYTRA